MNINFFSKKKIKNEPTTEEFIERGFAPRNGKVDILFINPPSTLAERYGNEIFVYSTKGKSKEN